MHLRDAVCPPPHLPAVARVAVTVAVLTTIVVAGAFVSLRRTMHLCFTEQAPAGMPTIDIPIPSIEAAVATADELALVQREVRGYAFEAFPSWAASHPDRACPDRLLQLNVYDPSLHAVDPWGTPYQFLCGEQHGVSGARVRSAGPDRVFDTPDDLASH